MFHFSATLKHDNYQNGGILQIKLAMLAYVSTTRVTDNKQVKHEHSEIANLCHD